jgi:cytoskeleton-associated protein 5
LDKIQSCSLAYSSYLLSGISERVADIKTRAYAMKCLTTFTEAVGPGFVFDRVSIITAHH